MTRAKLIQHLKNDVYVRLKKSKHGIGVFAIRDIPKGVDPFVGCDNTGRELKIKRDELTGLNLEVFKLLQDFCVFENGGYWIPANGLNSINVAWYLNHSKAPNMYASNHGEDFLPLRDIKAGEELLVDYDTYDESGDAANYGMK